MSELATAPFVIEREYGLSHADVVRVLPRIIQASMTRKADTFTLRFPDGCELSLRLGPERERRLGLLRIPVTDLTFTFTGAGWATGTPREFMFQFERAFQKGGG
ncbi:MAG: hypothetical protein HYX63_17065 [Gammaproteobacteria bacterium]|nr:hypothetical protein [Gammaproteobacteria bacterium]